MPRSIPSQSRLLSLVLCCLAWVLGGCAVGPRASLRSQDRITTFGANPQFDNERYEMVDLITLLDPQNRRSGLTTTNTSVNLFNLGPSEAAANVDDAEARRQFALAEIAFYDPSYGEASPRRDRIQDRLIGASNQRCAAYKVYLNRFDAYQQSGFGSATTLLGGAAGIFSGVKDARILGSLAGITSGVQAEIAQGFLGNLASYVIVPGIELRRKGILEDIRSRRSNSGDYTLQAALADAARYHGACTLVVGLEQAKEAIQTVENPGMRMMTVTLNNVMQTRAMQRTIAKQDVGPISSDDLLIPSFKLNDQPINAAPGRAGVRFAPNTGAASNTPEGLARRATEEMSAEVLHKAQRAIERLTLQIDALQTEIDTPTKPALIVKFKAVRAAMLTRIDKLKVAKAALAGTAVANAGVAGGALTCLAQLDQRLRVADGADVAVADTDLDLGLSLVSNNYTRWLKDKRNAISAWDQQLKVALDAGAFKTLAEKAASAIDAEAIGAGLDESIDSGKRLLGDFPVVNFKARGVNACA